MQSLARDALLTHGLSASPSLVKYCIDHVRSGHRPSALGHAAHGVAEIATSIVNIVRTLSAHGMPSFLNPPGKHEMVMWDDDSQDWNVDVDLDTSSAATMALLLRMIRELPYDGDPSQDPEALKAFTVWFRDAPRIQVMAGKSQVGWLSIADSDELRPSLREAQRRGAVLAAEAAISGAKAEDSSIRIYLSRAR